MENRKAAIEWFSMLKEKFAKTEYDGYLDMAISALEKQDADRWIPVTERLPEESNLYTVTAYERGERIVFDLYFGKTKGWDGWWDTKVIAWRKRPEPYTEEEV